jgi:hypothetical protein
LSVLVNPPKLARSAARQLPDRRPADRGYHHDAGLKVQCEIDPNTYPAIVKVTNAEMDAINIRRHKFHSNGNYTIKPQTRFAVIVCERTP